jgi:hypothetical protein
MKKHTPALAQLNQRHEQLCRQLSQLGLLSQGSVQDRTARQGGGAGYQWTRKVAGKTVTVSLTAQQFGKMKEAVGNYRTLRHQLSQIEKVSRQIIFQNTPHPSRRKHLSQRVLGIK